MATATSGRVPAGRIDVTDLPVDRLREYARGREEVHLERRGGHTYLVAATA